MMGVVRMHLHTIIVFVGNCGLVEVVLIMFRELILWLGEFACIIVGVLGAFGQCRTLRSSIGSCPHMNSKTVNKVVS